MLLEALVFLVVVLVVLHPLVQRQRERVLARRLEKVREPHAASALIEAASSVNSAERGTIRTLREIFWPVLFR